MPGQCLLQLGGGEKKKKTETNVTLCFLSYRHEENPLIEKGILKPTISKKKKKIPYGLSMTTWQKKMSEKKRFIQMIMTTN